MMGSRADPFVNRFAFKANGSAHPVYHAGKGPTVVLMHELPGMISEFWRLAWWLVEAGLEVWAPDLWAKPNAERPAVLGLGRGTARLCISREIHAFAADRSSPVVDYLRALVRHAAAGEGAAVGVIGLCMTGNFALSLVTEPEVAAAVASEPALPMGPWQRSRLHLTSAEADALARREDVPVLALRFCGDPICTAGKFSALRGAVGERLEVIEIDDAYMNPDGNPFPHAVLTKDLIDADGEPTRQAVDRIIGVLKTTLSETDGMRA